MAAPAAATVYKWVDEKGVVNYTTTPPSNRKTATVDVAPAVAGQGVVMDFDEARYWRARNARETASNMEHDRLRRDTEQLRQTRLRQEIAAAESDARQKSAAQLALDQCRRERRVDCETNPTGTFGTSLYPYPQVVVVARRPAAATASGSYFSVTPNFTPGYSSPQIYSRSVR
jgi:hypothetical protein